MDRYPSISNHGLIGDLQTAALVCGSPMPHSSGAAPRRRYAMQANGTVPEAGGQCRVRAARR